MNGVDLVRSAVSNSLRSKTRTALTVIAIVIGAFTLTLTSGVGTGINAYIDTTVASIGASGVMTVTTTAEETTSGPTEYNPDSTALAVNGPPGQNNTVEAITPADITEIEGVSGVLSVEASLAVRADYVEYNGGTQFQATVGSFIPGMSLDLATGAEPDSASGDYEVALPTSYVEPLGFSSDADAVGSTVFLGVTDATGAASVVEATVVGVTAEGLVSSTSIIPNTALTDELYAVQSVGLADTAKDSYASAVVRFDEASSDEQVAALKADLADLGFDGITVDDQIGAFKTIIDAIVLVLNGFAIIALVAAGFGIVNTLLMSVQERTREIGLMKAMGMSGGKVFGLFSLEAVFIGFLGSGIGVLLGMLAGGTINTVLANGLLAALPGLTLVAFDPVSVGVIVLAIMGIAFLAGTIPALRAARQDPIESLRYE